MEVILLVLDGKHSGERITLPRTQLVIGRDDSCHLRPVSTDVSKFHCAIARLGNRVLLRDLNSTNGTYLNDHRITRTTNVADGDVLRVGPLKFMFQMVRDAIAPTSGDSHLGWLLRSPDEQEHKVLDPPDTTIIQNFTAAMGDKNAPSQIAGTGSQPDEATVVAGRFLREYVASRKHSKNK
jgi:pSer/pThr/pTyr-binding forkhead associated (FHA) protein